MTSCLYTDKVSSHEPEQKSRSRGEKVDFGKGPTKAFDSVTYCSVLFFSFTVWPTLSGFQKHLFAHTPTSTELAISGEMSLNPSIRGPRSTYTSISADLVALFLPLRTPRSHRTAFSVVGLVAGRHGRAVCRLGGGLQGRRAPPREGAQGGGRQARPLRHLFQWGSARGRQGRDSRDRRAQGRGRRPRAPPGVHPQQDRRPGLRARLRHHPARRGAVSGYEPYASF